MYESILVSILERRPVNRGFLNGPLCPIYGAGAVGAVVVLGQVHNPLVVFLLSMVGASILEYVTSWVMEALFHARWWDYSDYKFNLNGRICLLGAFVFGVGRRAHHVGDPGRRLQVSPTGCRCPPSIGCAGCCSCSR